MAIIEIPSIFYDSQFFRVMICPRCACDKTKVNATIKGLKNERWRKCPKCGYVFSTIEITKHDEYLKKYAKSLFEEEKDNGKI